MTWLIREEYQFWGFFMKVSEKFQFQKKLRNGGEDFEKSNLRKNV